MPKVDIDAIPPTNRTGYPSPYDRAVSGRWQRPVAEAAGLTDFGVRHVTLEPGAWSSQRHWHEGEDEIVVMISGTATLVEEGKHTLLQAGDVAAFPKNVPNGHHLINEGETPCTFIAVGQNTGQPCHYPDIDLLAGGPGSQYFHKDGSPY